MLLSFTKNFWHLKGQNDALILLELAFKMPKRSILNAYIWHFKYQNSHFKCQHWCLTMKWTPGQKKIRKRNRLQNFAQVNKFQNQIKSRNILYNLNKDTLSITHPSSTAILIQCIDLHTCSNWLSYLF